MRWQGKYRLNHIQPQQQNIRREGDARRLIPEGKFLSPSLWIKSCQTSNANSIFEDWLKRINYDEIANTIMDVKVDNPHLFIIYNLSGQLIAKTFKTLENLPNGIYIADGTKIKLSRK